MGVTSNWCHPQGHHARRPPTTVPTLVKVFPKHQQTRENETNTNTVIVFDKAQMEKPGALNENVYNSDSKYFNTTPADNITPQDTTRLEVNVTTPNKKQTEAITSSLSNKTTVEVAVSCQQTRESGISTNTVPDIDETQEHEPGALNENNVYHSDPKYFNTKTAKNISPQKNTTLLEVNVTIPNKKQTEAITSSLTHKTPVEFLLIINKKEKEGRTQRLFQTMMKYKWTSMPLVMKITFAVMIRCMSMLHLLS